MDRSFQLIGLIPRSVIAGSFQNHIFCFVKTINWLPKWLYHAKLYTIIIVLVAYTSSPIFGFVNDLDFTNCYLGVMVSHCCYCLQVPSDISCWAFPRAYLPCIYLPWWGIHSGHLLFFFFSWLHCAVQWNLPNHGSDSYPLRWKLRVLTSGPPGKSFTHFQNGLLDF